MSIFYRESPAPLVAWPMGDVDVNNPAPTMAGMIDMRLNFAGRLRAVRGDSAGEIGRAAAVRL